MILRPIKSIKYVGASRYLKFIGWKVAEITIYILAFPFLFVGCWGVDVSDWCHDRALHHRPPSTGHMTKEEIAREKTLIN